MQILNNIPCDLVYVGRTALGIENSIFPEGFFKNARIENRAESLGR